MSDTLQLEHLGGQKGWRLGITRLSAGDPVPTVSAVCVVSEARAGRQGVRVFRMMALAVDEGMRGQGLASEAMARMQASLLLEAGPRFEMRADMASCMTDDGAGFYASQGWTGGEGVWSWRSEATEVEGALRLLASGEALGQLLQECGQDMGAAEPKAAKQGAGCSKCRFRGTGCSKCRHPKALASVPEAAEPKAAEPEAAEPKAAEPEAAEPKAAKRGTGCSKCCFREAGCYPSCRPPKA